MGVPVHKSFYYRLKTKNPQPFTHHADGAGGVNPAVIFIGLSPADIISHPILKLAAVSKEISEKQDYSVRVQRKGTDEISILYDEFNHMLEQIQLRESERDKAEKKYRDIFENATYGIFQLSPHGHLLTANRLLPEFWVMTRPRMF